MTPTLSGGHNRWRPSIATCEKCNSRFRFDDLSIPPGGIRVRCSRCGHVFMLTQEVPEDLFPSYESFARYHRSRFKEEVSEEKETETYE